MGTTGNRSKKISLLSHDCLSATLFSDIFRNTLRVYKILFSLARIPLYYGWIYHNLTSLALKTTEVVPEFNC